MLSYDPFEKEEIADQPFLYSQLLGLLDSSEDANEDMMRTSSAISIVRGFLQQSKIDDTISKLMCDISNIERNSATIKSLQESKGKITSVITSLAQDSCISLKHNKNAKKGENTWTGKIKKIKSLNLRSGEVNGFDIDTCRGMQQVQEISDASIMKQLALDESEWSDMVSEMRVVNTGLRKEKDAYQEINRILLRENLDLRDTLKENNLLNEEQLKDLKDIYSVLQNLMKSKNLLMKKQRRFPKMNQNKQMIVNYYQNEILDYDKDFYNQYGIYVKPHGYSISSRKIESYIQIAEIQKYLQCNPVKAIDLFLI